jgi:GDP-L-fucose synthase
MMHRASELSHKARVFVAGHRGLVGSALVRSLTKRGYSTILTRTRQELDLIDAAAVRRFFDDERPDAVLLAAAKVGGIRANDTYRWDFIYENLQIQNSVLSAACDVPNIRVVFLGSSCIYPKMAPQPIKEEYLLTGPLEPTNEPYAIAKIAGVKMVDAAGTQHGQKWISVMPTNLYGPGDNFDLVTSHVLPAMMRKFHEAKVARARGEDASVHLWGTGNVYREFLHVDDLADATVQLMESSETGLINVGAGTDVTLRDLAALIQRTVGYEGPVRWDTSSPDGTPRKLLDSSKMRALGWQPRISLEEGIANTYAWYLQNVGNAGPA